MFEDIFAVQLFIKIYFSHKNFFVFVVSWNDFS